MYFATKRMICQQILKKHRDPMNMSRSSVKLYLNFFLTAACFIHRLSSQKTGKRKKYLNFRIVDVPKSYLYSPLNIYHIKLNATIEVCIMIVTLTVNSSALLLTTLGSNTNSPSANPVPKGNLHTPYANSLSSQFSPMLFLIDF
jgi:hypothetical protein